MSGDLSVNWARLSDITSQQEKTSQPNESHCIGCVPFFNYSGSTRNRQNLVLNMQDLKLVKLWPT